MMSPEDRYANDPDFNALVRMLEAYIDKAQYTPSEVREAAILAYIHYEQRRFPRHFMRADMESLRLVREAKARFERAERDLEHAAGNVAYGDEEKR